MWAPTFTLSNRKALCPVCKTWVEKVWVADLGMTKAGFASVQIVACERCAES